MNWKDHELQLIDYGHPSGQVIKVGISKVGGGTVGHEYEGLWEYTYIRGSLHKQGADLRIGMPGTHSHAARIIMDCFEDH